MVELTIPHLWGEIVANFKKCAQNVVLGKFFEVGRLKTTFYAQKTQIF